jgi:hypothetical protein
MLESLPEEVDDRLRFPTESSGGEDSVLGSGRIATSAREAPIILANLV